MILTWTGWGVILLVDEGIATQVVICRSCDFEKKWGDIRTAMKFVLLHSCHGKKEAERMKVIAEKWLTKTHEWFLLSEASETTIIPLQKSRPTPER